MLFLPIRYYLIKHSFSFSSSDKNYYDPRDISRVKSDDYFVEQFINAKEGNVDKAHKIMVLSVRVHF